jgi:diguanylate cyclase (GGDEF)-like protein
MDVQDRSTILLIDQSPKHLDQLESVLGQEARVAFAGTGEEALAYATAQQPHLVLLDVSEPSFDAYEICRHLKNNPFTRDIPVVLISAHEDDEDEAKGLQLGAVDYITRPITSIIVFARLLNHLATARANVELKRLATTDSLTGAFNRRHFLELATKEVARMRRYRHAVSCMMIDIDHFKNVNDTYGHHVGDQAIVAAAKVARAALRTEDVFGRLGGEEFAAMLPVTALAKAEQVSQRLRLSIAAIRLPTDFAELSFTVSIGLVEISGEGESFEQALKRADEALYEAKHRGRNQVVIRQADAAGGLAVYAPATALGHERRLAN